MSVLSDIDEEAFIDKIKKYPALYNDQHSDYTNRSKKEEIWSEISKFMDQPVNLCKRKWDVLRANFRRAHRLKKNGVRKRLWRHYKRMTFLLPFTKTDETAEEIKQEQPFTATEPEVVLGENVDDALDDKNGLDKATANIQFFTSMAMTINSFPTEHQVRIKMMLLQQVSEVQLLMENLPAPDFPISPFTE